MNGRIDSCAYEFGELDVNEQIFCCRVRRQKISTGWCKVCWNYLSWNRV